VVVLPVPRRDSRSIFHAPEETFDQCRAVIGGEARRGPDLNGLDLRIRLRGEESCFNLFFVLTRLTPDRRGIRWITQPPRTGLLEGRRGDVIGDPEAAKKPHTKDRLMSVRSAHPWGRPPIGGRKRLTTAAAMLGAALLLAASISVAGPAGATTSVAPTGSAQVSDNGTALTVTVAASVDAPGYRIVVSRSPFQVTTQRSDGTVLQTTTGIAGSSGPVDFLTASGWQTATAVQGWSWQDGGLELTLATTAGVTIDDRIVPQPDRYRMTWSAPGATQVASHYVVASAGHWYGQGEATTPDGGPYTAQPWPLDSGVVRDTAMGPAEYLMTDPFWFTQRGSGLWVNTRDVMDVALNAVQPGVFGYTLTASDAMDSTVFVERTPRDVYTDYIGITGTPAKSEELTRSTPSRCGTRGASSTRASRRIRRWRGRKGCMTRVFRRRQSRSMTAG
jgi:hypothetical protein